MIRRILSIAVCFSITLALVACGNNTGTGNVNLSVDQIAENSIQAFQGLQSYEGLVRFDFTEPTAGWLTIEVWMDGALTLGSMAGEPPRFRGEVIDSTIEGLPGGTVAIFAPTSFFYNPDEQVVYTAKQGTPGAAAQLYRLPMLFITTMNQMLQTLTVPTVNQTVVGKEKLGEFDTIKIEATAAPDATSGPLTGDDKTTIWIDTATNLPVKIITVTDAHGTQTMTVSEMKVNQGVDAERFSYDPPADATVIELGPPVTVASLEEASSQAGFTAPRPGYLPEGVPTTPTTVSVQETPAGFSIMQTYGEGGESGAVYIDTLQLTSALAQLPLAPPPGASSSKVDINGVEALVLVIGEGQASVSMRQGDFLYVIRGNGFGEDEIIKVAEQLQMS